MVDANGRVHIDYDEIYRARMEQKIQKEIMKKIDAKVNSDWIKTRDSIEIKLPKDVNLNSFDIFDDESKNDYLKPCPFCGENVERRGGGIECVYCRVFMDGSGVPKENTDKRWNRRVLR